MTKRKRTPPPPPPKPFVFTVPPSLTNFAQMCRQLRDQSEVLVERAPRRHQIPPTPDQAIDLAADAQLNDQLIATLEAPAQQAASNPNPRNARKKQPKQSLGKARAPEISNDEEIRQSIIRDAEQQLGIDSNSFTDAPTTHAHAAAEAPDPLMQPNYYDQSSTVAQIRFDPYVAPGQPAPYQFVTSQFPPTTFPDGQAAQYPYPNPILPSSDTSNYNSPYVNIAPHPSGSSRTSGSQQFSFPVNQTQPGYYRLPPSYWQSPPPLQTGAMTEANQRAVASVGMSGNPGPGLVDQRHGLRTLYPDPTGTMDMGVSDGVGVMNGGVFRNLTKEKFGRYSVGGKLVNQREIYG